MRLDEPAESLYARELRRDPLCWAALLDRAVQGVTLRSPFLGHPRVLILGGIEARALR